MALKRGNGDNLFSKVFRTRNYAENDKYAPVTLVRPGVRGTSRVLQTGVVNETYGHLIEETADLSYDVDFLIPAYSLVRDIFVVNLVAWTAATSAVLDAGDYAWTSSAVGAAIDADGFWADLDLKTLAATSVVNLTHAGPVASEGAYIPFDVTSVTTLATRVPTKLFSTTARVIRFNVTKVGAGTAGRTYVGVTFAQLAETADTISS